MEDSLLWPATATGRMMTTFLTVSVGVLLALNMPLVQRAVAEVMVNTFWDRP